MSNSLVSFAEMYKEAFYTRAVTLFAADPQVQVAFGHPGTSMSDDIVAFMGVTTDQVEATMATNRSREETLSLTVIISCYAAGNTDGDLTPSKRAFSLLGSLENYVRTTDTTLGLAANGLRQCFLTSISTSAATDEAYLAAGRLVEIIAVFTAQARISN